MCFRTQTRRRGFSLIEIAAVLVLIGILTAAVTVVASRVLAPLQLRRAVSGVVAADRLARTAARSEGGAVLRFDADSSTIARTSAEPSALHKDEAHVAHLPARCELLGVYVLPERTLSPRAVIPLSTEGCSPSYAVGVSGPNGDARWILFSGLTGVATTLENEDVIGKLSEAMLQPRLHAP